MFLPAPNQKKKSKALRNFIRVLVAVLGLAPWDVYFILCIFSAAHM